MFSIRGAKVGKRGKREDRVVDGGLADSSSQIPRDWGMVVVELELREPREV